MKIEDLMTKNATYCSPDDSLQGVAEKMEENDCGMIPIMQTNGNKKLVGVVTDRDITLRAVAQGNNPLEMNASDVMTSNPVTIKPDASEEEGAEMMEKHKIRRLVVCDDNDEFVGVIAQADFARQADDDEVSEIVEEVSEPGHRSK